MVKQVLVHEAPIAFRVLLGQAAVLVQIHGGHLGEIQVALVVPLHQLGVGPHRGAARCQAQHAVGFHDDLRGDDVGCLAGHILVIFCTNDLHTNNLPVFYGPRSAAVIQLLSVYHRTAGSTIPAKRQRTEQEPPGPGTNTRPRRPQECFLAESTSFSANMSVAGAVRYSIFFSSSYTNCTLVPMTTWQVLLSGRMTPAAPAAFTAFSSTWV